MALLQDDGLLKNIINFSSEFVIVDLQCCDLLLVGFIILEEDIDIGFDFSDFVDPLPQDGVFLAEVFEF